MASLRPAHTLSTPTTKLSQSLLIWLTALAPSLPSLSELDDATGEPKRTVSRLDDLGDGIVLSDVVGELDPAYFRPHNVPASTRVLALSDNWVLRFNNLKRLYKLLIRYFEDVLHASTAALPAPNLQLIAKGGEGSEEEVCRLAGLILALVVQSEKRQQHVERIQSLDEWVQRELMWSIEQVMSKVATRGEKDKDKEASTTDADSEFYDLQHERSRLLTEKETLQVVYEELVRSYNNLKSDHEEALSSLTVAEARTAKTTEVGAGNTERMEVVFKKELERLRSDLQKKENELGESEVVVERQTKMLEDLTRKIDDLVPKAEEAVRLKDQMDEYRHAADRGKKTENVIEKYKKKLEESADLRRTIKTLEYQISGLLDDNAALEAEYNKASSFKPLMESYKSQLDALENKSSHLSRANDSLRHQLEVTQNKLKVSEMEIEKEREALALYEERLMEFEESGAVAKRMTQARGHNPVAVGEMEDGGVFAGVDEELDNAISGTTMADLKLQLRKLKRELETAKASKADGSRIVVLENLLEEANRMKKRYEADFLREHREKLVIEGKLEEIMSGKSGLEDIPEAEMALRLTLSETLEQLDVMRQKHAALEGRFDSTVMELTIAKSDLNLVNKDEVDILKSLRASVSVEKDELAREVERLKAVIRTVDDKAQMQLSEINGLLMEKVALQSDGIGQREKLLEQERNFGSEHRVRFASLEQQNSKFKLEIKELREKLQKAKDFIMQQDRLFKEAHESEHHGNFEEAEQSYRSQIRTLTDELERQKSNSTEIEARYRREHQLMLSAWHNLSMQNMRKVVASSASGAGPTSWLAQQRARTISRSLRNP